MSTLHTGFGALNFDSPICSSSKKGWSLWLPQQAEIDHEFLNMLLMLTFSQIVICLDGKGRSFALLARLRARVGLARAGSNLL